MIATARQLLIVTTCLFLLVAAGCDETDPDLLVTIGVAAPLLVNTAIAPQSIIEPGRPQVAVWQVHEAVLNQGGASVDLLFQEECDFRQSTKFGAFGAGKCATGVVINATSAGDHILLSPLGFRMQVARAEPVDLDCGAGGACDLDGDGVRNDRDNCPLVDNPDQADADGNGNGDACTLSTPTGSLLDTDGDGIPDVADNCVWIPNGSQADTSGLTADVHLPDGIGDACPTQVAQVVSGGNPVLRLEGLVLDLATPAQGNLLVVDFGEALECDWTAGNCELIENRVEFCAHFSITLARLGCAG